MQIQLQMFAMTIGIPPHNEWPLEFGSWKGCLVVLGRLSSPSAFLQLPTAYFRFLMILFSYWEHQLSTSSQFESGWRRFDELLSSGWMVAAASSKKMVLYRTWYLVPGTREFQPPSVASRASQRFKTAKFPDLLSVCMGVATQIFLKARRAPV